MVWKGFPAFPAHLMMRPVSRGKNIGVGCHFLLQCMKVKSLSRSVTQLCPIFSEAMDCSLPGSSIHGIFQVRVLEWGAIAFSVWITTNCGKFLQGPVSSPTSPLPFRYFFSSRKVVPGSGDQAP